MTAATIIRLPALDDAAVELVMGDVLGGQADIRLRQVAERGLGSPFLLSELLEGLKEDGLVRVVDGHAELTADRLPDRLGKSMLERLKSLQPETRQLVRVASILGTRFSFELLAAMMQEPATAIIAPLEEAIAAGPARRSRRSARLPSRPRSRGGARDPA